jgi:hypothetical protein
MRRSVPLSLVLTFSTKELRTGALRLTVARFRVRRGPSPDKRQRTTFPGVIRKVLVAVGAAISAMTEKQCTLACTSHLRELTA